jgi:hypothetical protein
MVMAAITLAMAFGVDLTPAQVGSISAFLTAVGAFIIQAGVFSKNTHEREVNTARRLSYSAGQSRHEDGSVDLSLLSDLFMMVVATLVAIAAVRWVVSVMLSLMGGPS